MNASSSPSRTQWAILGVILALAATLRIARADWGSLTFDEQWHMELSTGRGSPHVRLPDDVLIPNAPAVTSLNDAPPWWNVWTNMDFVVHPPLYCTLLRIWREIFGGGDRAAQMLSVTCAMIAIALLFDAVRLLSGPSIALWACLILAVAPTQVLLGQQVRGYMLLEALAMGACLAVVRLEKLGFIWRRIAAVGACVLGLMLTHYLAIGACAALLAYSLIRLSGKARTATAAAYAVAAFIYAIVWGPFFWQQRKNFAGTADPWLLEQTPDHVRLTIARAIAAPWHQLVQVGPAVLAWIVLLIAVIALAQLWRRRELLLWCLWLVGTLGLLLGLDLIRSTRHLDFVRYATLAAPAIAALIASAGSQLNALWKCVVPVAVALTCVCYSRSAYLPEEPDWRDLGTVIDANVAPGEAIVFYAGRQPPWYREIFYLGAAHYSHAFPRAIVKLSHPASAELVAQLPGESAWLISGQLDRPPEEILPGCRAVDQKIIPNLAICTRLVLPMR